MRKRICSMTKTATHRLVRGLTLNPSSNSLFLQANSPPWVCRVSRQCNPLRPLRRVIPTARYMVE